MKKSKIKLIIFLIILLIIIAIFGLKFLISNNNLNFNKEEEIMFLNNNINEIKSSLSIITVLTSIDKYNAGGNYITKKNKNLLEDNETKQLFIMEQIISNQNNYSNFIILNNNGEEDEQLTIPTEDAIYAYYPYDLFINIYNKYFNEVFDIEKRTISYQNNKYDLNDKYIYYNNRRAGLNGLIIDTIDVNNITKLSANEYIADLSLNYSKRLASMLNIDKEDATLNYIKDNDDIKLISYQLK